MTDFRGDVLLAFSALVTKFSLICVVLNNRLIRFQNDHVFLAIHYDDAISFEVGVEIGERTLGDAMERPFNLEEILRLKYQPQDSAWVRQLQVSDKAHLSIALTKLARLVETYATDLLNHDGNAFAALSNFRNEECEKYAIERELQMARIKAESAWAAKNYEAVIDAFQPVRIHLSEAENKRLLYAETHVLKK